MITVLSLINIPGGITFSKKKKKRGGGGAIMVLKFKKNVFPNTPKNFVQMILNNLQIIKQNPKTNERFQEKSYYIYEHQQVQWYIQTSKYGNLSKNTGFLRQWMA